MNTLFHKGVWSTLKETVLATIKHATTLEGSLSDQCLCFYNSLIPNPWFWESAKQSLDKILQDTNQ